MKTCEQRIDKNLKSRLQDFKEALKQARKDKIIEDFINWISSYALAYSDDSYYRAKRLELSYGGPQDYFLFFEDGSIEYHFLDWFDGAQRTLEGEDYETMQKVKDLLAV